MTHEYNYNNDDLLDLFTRNIESIASIGNDRSSVKTFLYSNDTIITKDESFVGGVLLKTSIRKKIDYTSKELRFDFINGLTGELNFYSINYYGIFGISNAECYYPDNKLRNTRVFNYNNDCNHFK